MKRAHDGPGASRQPLSSYDKTAAFTTFKTYGWIAGQPAFDPAAHTTIVSAIDAEMTSLGLKKSKDGREM